jgi:hypothetical protein
MTMTVTELEWRRIGRRLAEVDRPAFDHLLDTSRAAAGLPSWSDVDWNIVGEILLIENRPARHRLIAAAAIVVASHDGYGVDASGDVHAGLLAQARGKSAAA